MEGYLYCDADFASGQKSSKSARGSYIALVGPNTFMPISHICKKQIVISHSSTESEIVALEIALRTEALPLVALWDVICDVFMDAFPTQPRKLSKGDPARAGDPAARGSTRSMASGGGNPTSMLCSLAPKFHEAWKTSKILK